MQTTPVLPARLVNRNLSGNHSKVERHTERTVGGKSGLRSSSCWDSPASLKDSPLHDSSQAYEVEWLDDVSSKMAARLKASFSPFVPENVVKSKEVEEPPILVQQKCRETSPKQNHKRKLILRMLDAVHECSGLSNSTSHDDNTDNSASGDYEDSLLAGFCCSEIDISSDNVSILDKFCSQNSTCREAELAENSNAQCLNSISPSEYLEDQLLAQISVDYADDRCSSDMSAESTTACHLKSGNTSLSNESNEKQLRVTINRNRAKALRKLRLTERSRRKSANDT